MTQPSRILIYGLLNPINNELFYIGQTRKRREFRLLEHIAASVEGGSAPVYNYIRDLMENGRIPEIFVLEKVIHIDHVDFAEMRWIKHYATISPSAFPVTISPQTLKSKEVVLRSVALTNVTHNPL